MRKSMKSRKPYSSHDANTMYFYAHCKFIHKLYLAYSQNIVFSSNLK